MKASKSFVLPVVLGFCSATSVFSGEPVMEPIPAPSPPVSEPVDLWSWFIGGGAGYLTDNETEYYHGHFGLEYGALNDISHKFFLDLGYAEDLEERSGRFLLTPGNYDGDPEDIENDAVLRFDSSLEVMPVMFNYQFEGAFSDSFRWYIGAGAGVAFLDLDYGYDIRGENEGELYARQNESDDDTLFAAQVFAGLIWEVSENFEIYGGARYIYVDDPDFEDVIDGDDLDIELDDVLVELGLRFSF